MNADLTTPEDRFEKWFAEPLRVLMNYQHTGFVVMLAALSLLERLIRWRSSAGDVEGIEAHLPEVSRIFLPSWDTSRLSGPHIVTALRTELHSRPRPVAETLSQSSDSRGREMPFG